MSDNPDKPQYRIGSGDNQHSWLTPAEWSQVHGDFTAPTAQPHLSAVWHWSARRQWRCLDLLLSRLFWKRKD